MKNKTLPLPEVEAAISTNKLLQVKPPKLKDSKMILWFMSKSTYVI
jgi:hypothetical protein